MKVVSYTYLFLFIFSVNSYGQRGEGHQAHHHLAAHPHYRVAALIGHTLIPAEDAGENFFIPSWGLDLEYWFNQQWGLGLHSDLEIETFVILNNNSEGEALERLSPLVLTLDVLYKPWKGLVLQMGPGIEFERSENFALFRLGIEYEFEIHDHWDIAPTIFYDSRLDEYQTWSFALGIGKRF